MLRDVVKIDENLCTGCGDCVPGCHEGALQIIDGKARLISDLLCDGLGACLGHCPTGALTIEKREAEPYDELKVMALMVEKGHNTVVAHMKHLKEHGETGFLKQAVGYLKTNASVISLDVPAIISEVHNSGGSCAVRHDNHKPVMKMQHAGSSCPGSKSMSFAPAGVTGATAANSEDFTALSQWPVQMHLINPAAGYFNGADVLIAADCVAFAMGNFHQRFLTGKKLCIACPKLDSGLETYLDKMKRLINESAINTLTVVIMEVPCCSGLLRLAQIAVDQASRKIPLKAVTVSIQGKVLKEEWV
ncbi:ATP-binding protein [Saccharicrinis sp. FJH54]|uniref:ATP-binding protein n=1 Tax=Saccharicrinis sp. FJH54 TaxID=3344665 RepID=UPI0035D5174E